MQMCQRDYVSLYLSRARTNVPCNWAIVASFFVTFVLLDHIRGLGTLIGLLVLLPLHCNKRANEDIKTTATSVTSWLVLCTETPGGHRSCTALYFWCAANGITESLALTLHGPVEKTLPTVVQLILLLALWGLTLVIAALLIDSLTLNNNSSSSSNSKAAVDLESPVVVVRHTSVSPAPRSSVQ